MRQVYAVWFVKKALPYLAAEAIAFAGFMYFLGQQVYVANVLEYSMAILSGNMTHPLAFISFAVDLFLRTRLGVQISVIGSLAMVFFLFRNVISSAVQLTLAKGEFLKGRNQIS